MKQNIRFKGLTLNRDEQAAEYGELALCGNVEVHDGALRPSVLKGTTLAGGHDLPGKLLYVHVTPSGFTNFIVRREGQGGVWLEWYTENSDHDDWATGSHNLLTVSDLGASGASFNSISSVGNTLCVMTSYGLFYVLFKDGAYTVLGRKPPFVELQFNLDNETDDDANEENRNISSGNTGVGLFKDSTTIRIEYQPAASDPYHTTGHIPVTEALRTSISEQVMAEVNKRIYDAEEKGLFYAPFWVRYCYRLYDGSMIMHSAPVLMTPSLQRSILVSIVQFAEKDGSKLILKNFQEDFSIRVFMMLGKLQVRCVNSDIWNPNQGNELGKWSDIVKSVDIFITPQFSRIDASKQINYINKYPSGDTCVSLMEGNEYDFINEYHDTVDNESGGSSVTFINDNIFELPEFDLDTHLNRIRSAGEFFRIASIKIDDLSPLGTDNFTNVDMSGNNLHDIATHEQMKDDYKSHNFLLPDNGNQGGILYTYNHRLNIYSIKEVLFEGFRPRIMFAYVSDTCTSTNRETIGDVLTFIKSGDNMKKVKFHRTIENNTEQVPILNWQLDYFFYPDNRAVYTAIQYFIVTPTPGSDYHLFSLSPHQSLNGAIIDEKVQYNNTLKNNLVSDTTTPLDYYSPLRGKIYTSKADNPFYFPNLPGESGINTVGTGDIIGIAAVTRALSQGQVGDHDLVVFASDGIWVMKVSSTGTYTSMHNISREVCSNPQSICQLDQSIIFASRRSLSRFRESDVVSISEVLDGPIISWSSMLPTFYALFYQDPTHPESMDPVKKMLQDLLDFGTPAVNLFQSGIVLYDYASSRLLVFPNDVQENIAMAFSLRDNTWSTLYTGTIFAAVPGYPSPYIQRAGQIEEEDPDTHETVMVDVQQLVRLDLPYDYDTNTATDALVITRTLSFSDTMDLIRGFRQYCECSTMPTLYFFGSNDQLSWKSFGNSARSFHNYMPGHPFRFFRVAIVFHMTMKEKYQSLMLEIVNKYAKL